MKENTPINEQVDTELQNYINNGGIVHALCDLADELQSRASILSPRIFISTL